ncbi:MAG: pilus assembly protein [Ottowia sp.]|nr:pilus assembly protein [Ottowia sp.]
MFINKRQNRFYPQEERLRYPVRRYTQPFLGHFKNKETPSQQGQATLEILICLPILIVTALSIIQLSLLIYAQALVDHAGFITARAGSITTLSTRELLSIYKSTSRKLGRSEIQLEIMLSQKTVDNTAALTLRITHGYKPAIPLVGNLFFKAMRLYQIASPPNPRFRDAFIQKLLQHQHIPLYTEISLPLHPDMPEYLADLI